MNKISKWVSVITLITLVVTATITPAYAKSWEYYKKPAQKAPYSYQFTQWGNKYLKPSFKQIIQNIPTLDVELSAQTPFAQVVQPGARDLPLISIDVKNSSIEDVELNSIDFIPRGEQMGLDDFKLVSQDGRVLSNVDLLNGRVSFELVDGYVIDRGEINKLTVTADIGDIVAGSRFWLELQEANDLFGKGMATEMDANFTGHFPIVGNTMTIQDNTILIELSASSPEAQTVVVGERDVELFSFKVSAGNEDVALEEINLSVDDAEPAAFQNLRLIDNTDGALVAMRAGMIGHEIQFFSDDLVVERNSNKRFTVMADISPMAEPGQVVVVSLNNGEDVRAIGQLTGDRVRVTGRFPIRSNAVTVRAEGDLSAFLDANTPTRLMFGSQNVLIFDLLALEDDILIDEFRFRIEGIDSNLQINSGSVSSEGIRLGRAHAAADTGEIFIRLAEPVVVADGESKQFVLNAEIIGGNARAARASLLDVNATGAGSATEIEVDNLPLTSILTF